MLIATGDFALNIQYCQMKKNIKVYIEIFFR